MLQPQGEGGERVLAMILDRLRKLGGPPVPRPETPLIVVGDIHGSIRPLERLLWRLRRDPDAMQPGTRMVFVGDLVDRGPDSRDVIDRVRLLQAEGPWQVECLMGNHEAMLLDFLDPDPCETRADPAKRAARWLNNGGDATLASFGVPLPATAEQSDGLNALRAALAQAMGSVRIDWLRSRPLYVRSGDVVAVHASWDRDRADGDQVPDILLWGRGAPRRLRPTAPPWVVHGHTITRPAQVTGTRIAVDSGAWLCGELSCALILPGTAPRLISTGATTD